MSADAAIIYATHAYEKRHSSCCLPRDERWRLSCGHDVDIGVRHVPRHDGHMITHIRARSSLARGHNALKGLLRRILRSITILTLYFTMIYTYSTGKFSPPFRITSCSQLNIDYIFHHGAPRSIRHAADMTPKAVSTLPTDFRPPRRRSPYPNYRAMIARARRCPLLFRRSPSMWRRYAYQCRALTAHTCRRHDARAPAPLMPYEEVEAGRRGSDNWPFLAATPAAAGGDAISRRFRRPRRRRARLPYYSHATPRKMRAWPTGMNYFRQAASR